MRRALAAFLWLSAWMAISPVRGSDETPLSAAPEKSPSPANVTGAFVEPERLSVDVLATYPHDAKAFTQGLLLYRGRLYESTGLYGRSSLREVEPESGRVLRQIDLSPELFGEGLARVGDRLVQLTWHERLAPVYERSTFAKVGELSYDGEGWGLCFDGTYLVMSDGTHRLYFRDPETFAIRRRLAVTERGKPLPRINELECVGDAIYANVWPTSRIVKIYKRNGRVGAVVDAGGLLSPAEREAIGAEAILNGIAYDERSKTFLVTGKLWPKLLRVRFRPANGP